MRRRPWSSRLPGIFAREQQSISLAEQGGTRSILLKKGGVLRQWTGQKQPLS